MMNPIKLIAACAALALVSQPVFAQDAAKKPKSETVKAAPMIVAKVNGLVCDFCAQALKKVFKKQDAVKSLNVDLDAGEVRIALKPGLNITDESVKTLIRKSGYSLVSTSRIGGA